jgi:trehalose/maltose transport system permease protein
MSVVTSLPFKNNARVQRIAYSTRQVRLAALMLIPTLLLLGLVAFYPLVRTFGASLTDEVFAREDLTRHFVGFANYQQLLSIQFLELPPGKSPAQVIPDGFYLMARFPFGDKTMLMVASDKEFLQSFLNTLTFAVISVSTEMFLGLGLAILVNANFPGRGLVRTLMLVPWVIPTVVSAQLWKWMLFDNRAGVINDLLYRLGVITQSYAWRADPHLQLISVALVDIWKTTPYVALILLAGLQTIPIDLYEASAVDGASKWRQFSEITLPLLRPILLLAFIFRTLDALRVFDIFSVLLGRDVQSLATYNQDKLLATSNYGYASAIGVVIFMLIFIFTVIYMSVFRIGERA